VALAIDASTPAIAVQSNGATATCTTASFTPPSGSTLLILYSANSIDPTSPAVPTITDNLGAHLTYTRYDHSVRSDTPNADGQACSWTAPVSSSAAMTVTVTNQAASGGRHAAVSVQVLTGADGTTPVPVHGESGSTSTGTVNQSYTANTTGGMGFTAIADWSATGVMTAGTGTTRIGSAAVGAPDYDYGFFRRTSADDVASSSNSVNATLGGTATSVRWIWVEAVPAAGGATVNADATLTNTATITAAAASDKPVTSSPSFTATITPAASSTKPIDATLTGTATITPAGASTKPVDSSLTATSARTAAASVTKPVDASPTTTATITAAAASTKPVDATLGLTATITAAASVTPAGKNIDAAPSFTATLTPAATTTKPLDAAVTATATITAAVSTTKPITAALTGTATISAGASTAAAQSAAAAVAVTATITAELTVGAITGGQLTATTRAGSSTSSTSLSGLLTLTSAGGDA